MEKDTLVEGYKDYCGEEVGKINTDLRALCANLAWMEDLLRKMVSRRKPLSQEHVLVPYFRQEEVNGESRWQRETTRFDKVLLRENREIYVLDKKSEIVPEKEISYLCKVKHVKEYETFTLFVVVPIFSIREKLELEKKVGNLERELSEKEDFLSSESFAKTFPGNSMAHAMQEALERRRKDGREEKRLEDAFDQALFDEGLDDFFDTLFNKVDNGEVSLEEAGRFFPKEVRERNALPD